MDSPRPDRQLAANGANPLWEALKKIRAAVLSAIPNTGIGNRNGKSGVVPERTYAQGDAAFS